MNYIFFGLIVCLGLVGCTTPLMVSPLTPGVLSVGIDESNSVCGQDEPVPVVSLEDRLLSHYKVWKGTPYRYGGTGRSGVDCSAFAQLTFDGCFDCPLPRTTATQVREGRAVSRSDLRAGDLVFFKTGSVSRHVGICVSPTLFMHASSSKGVTLSSLDNVYWQPRYWQARRVDLLSGK